MRRLNTVGKIKIFLLVLCSIPNLVYPATSAPETSLLMFLIPFIFGALGIPFLSNANSFLFQQHIETPHWNDNPLQLKWPMRLFQFAAAFFMVTGSSMVIGSALHHQVFNAFGLVALMFGLGIYLGIHLAVRWFGKEKAKGNNV